MSPRKKKASAPKSKNEVFNKRIQPEDENHYNALQQFKWEKCEFCDIEFPDRYRCLIHTGRHIIIPLIKHEIFTCQYCLHCFTSQEDLTSHKKVKHASDYLAEIMQDVVRNSISVSCEKIDLTLPENSETPKAKDAFKTRKEVAIKTYSNKKVINIDDLNNPVIMFNGQTMSLKSLKNSSMLNAKQIDKYDSQKSLRDLLLQPQKPMNMQSNKDSKNKPETSSNQPKTSLKQSIATLDQFIATLNQPSATLEQSITIPNQPIKMSNQSVIDSNKPVLKRPKIKSNRHKMLNKSLIDSNQPVKMVNQSLANSNQSELDSNQQVNMFNQTVTNSNQQLTMTNQPLKLANPPMTMVNQPINFINQPLTLLNQPFTLINPSNLNMLNQPLMINQVLGMLNQESDMLNQPLSMIPISTPAVIGPPNFLNNSSEPEEEFILPDISPRVPDKKTNKQPDLKSRIVFEDDIDIVDITDDADTVLPSTSKIPLSLSEMLQNGPPKNIFSLPTATLTKNASVNNFGGKIFNSNKITIVNGVIHRPGLNLNGCAEKTSVPEETKYTSVHYDELVRPGMFRCKRCGLTFPNKFDVVTHETAVHLRVKRKHYGALHCANCDWYIAGNYHSLNKHIATAHNSSEKRKNNVKMCDKCTLKYTNLQRHNDIYHWNEKPEISNMDSELKNSNLESIGRMDSKKVAKTVRSITYSQLCDVCSMFMKNNAFRKSYGNFQSEGVLQEYGKKYQCTNCKNVVDAVESFKIFKFSRGFHKEKEEKKVVTNEERLKKIQNRLIKIKKIKKF